MDFPSAEKERERLSSQLAAGQITRDACAAAVNALRVTDAEGKWWQPDPSGSGWLYWTGSAWQQGTPPGMPGAGPGQPQHARDFNEFKSSLMTVDEFRKMSKEVPITKRPQKWWDLLSILGGIVAAVIWLMYSGIREGFDLLTPLLMIGIPVILVWFRADIDVMLLPLQPHRQKFSKLLLTGMGMAFPFLTSFVLYSIGIREYPLMQWNMIIGTFGAYAITRTPAMGMPGTGAAPPAVKSPAPAVQGIVVLLLAAIGSFLVLPARADDCARDILNARDCLRTDGYAEVMSGFFSTILSTFVNGPTILQTLIAGGAGVQPPMPPSPPGQQPQTPVQQQDVPDLPNIPEQADEPEGPYNVTPEEQEQIDEALRQMRAEKEQMLAAAAARAAAEQQARDKMLDNLNRMEDSMVRRKEFSSEEFGRVSDQISRVRTQLYGKGDVDADKYSDVYRFFKRRVEGDTVPESMIPSEAQVFRDSIKGGIEGTSREIFTGRDVNGNFSKSSFVLRGLAAIPTGGSSEMLYTPASALYTMKAYVDKGGDSVIGAFTTAMKDVVIGELMGRGVGGVLKYGGKALGAVADNILPLSVSGSLKDGFTRLKDVLNTEIKNPFAGKTPPVKIPSGQTPSGISTFRTPPKTTGEIVKLIDKAKATGEPSPGLSDISFRKADRPPDLSGMTEYQQKYARMVFDRHGVNGAMRPTKTGAGAKVESGEALAKPEPIKAKSIDDEDILLGFDENSKTAVGCKKPTLPDQKTVGLKDDEFASLKKRYQKRVDDYNDNAPKLDELEAEGKIKWDKNNGLVTDAASGKKFVTDHDPFAYIDATTGKPVSQFTVNQINKDLQAGGITMHNEHVNWDYTKYPGPGQENSAFTKAFNNDTNILISHTEGAAKAQPLNMYNARTGEWETAWWTGGTRFPTKLPGGGGTGGGP